MNRATFCPRAPLGELFLRTATVIFLSAAASAHATTGALAISGTPPTSATVGQAYSFTPSVPDPSKHALHFNVWNKPAWATFNSNTGQLAGTPTAAYAGTQDYVDIGVTDGVANAYMRFWYITVRAATSAAGGLAISGTPATSATVGQAYSFRPTVSDPSKHALQFNVWNKPAWATFNSSTGQLTGTPTAAYAGTKDYVDIGVTDGVANAYMRFWYITVMAATSTADKPVISGTPPTGVTAGSTYKFQPAAKDPAGKALSFSVQNKPSWASFSISSGLLNGTPTSSQNGTYGNIIISASNGQYSSALPAFSVTVSSATSGTTGAATINWVQPTKNTNGSALTNLAGIRIYYGTSMANLNHMAQVAGATTKSTTIGNLAAGTWYFAGVAYTTSGVQSAMSAIVSKYVP